MKKTFAPPQKKLETALKEQGFRKMNRVPEVNNYYSILESIRSIAGGYPYEAEIFIKRIELEDGTVSEEYWYRLYDLRRERYD